jgi:SAM-dependent methyltransferase
MRQFLATFGLSAADRVLDVGGYPGTWEDAPVQSEVVILNIHPVSCDKTTLRQGISCVVGDGCRLPYPDGSFDVVYSNSVIEHLGNFERQAAFAAEMRRVGRSYWIQTPAREFPIEPHLLTPLIHYLPRAFQRRLLRNGTLWGWITRPSKGVVDDFLAEVRLIDAREMNLLFPNCKIYREKFLGLTKSYVAIHVDEARHRGDQALP